jgi:hypothetical protein
MKIGTIVGNRLAPVPVVGHFTECYRNGARQQRMLRKQAAMSVAEASPPPHEPQPQPTVESAPPEAVADVAAPPLPVADWLAARWPAEQPLGCFPAASRGVRVSVVTDAVDAASLFGGVGTSLVLAALLANRLGAGLRLVTRTVAPDTGAIGRVLAANGVCFDGRLEAIHVPHREGHGLPLCDDDFFLTTSWWTTRSLLATVHRDRIAYLLQEDERMFYPFGDDRLRCERTLSEPGLLTIVNSRLLFDHLVAGPDPIPGLADRADWFEPAFPEAGIRPASPRRSGRRRLFFYARPNHLRNLFACGIEALSNAVAAGIFHPDEWEIHLVGKHVPDLLFPRGLRPHRVEGLSWSDYQAFVRTMDAGFVLMDTPHPSYPPLDLAAAGAAVLTNARGVKRDLSRYSANIAVAELTPPALQAGLAALARAACDDEARAAAVQADGICRHWERALGPSVDRIARHFVHDSAPAAREAPAWLRAA